MYFDAYYGGTRNYFLAVGCERRQAQSLDPNEFVNVREVSLGDLVTFALTGQMTDPGGVMLALPYLTGDPEVRAALAPRHLPRSAQACAEPRLDPARSPSGEPTTCGADPRPAWAPRWTCR